MYTFSVSSLSGPSFQVRPPVVAFAGCRRGRLPESVAFSLSHAFHALDYSLLTGCASGIDACFRNAMAHKPFEAHSMVACAFENKARRFDDKGSSAFRSYPSGSLLRQHCIEERCGSCAAQGSWCSFPPILYSATGARAQHLPSVPPSTTSNLCSYRHQPRRVRHRCTESFRQTCSVSFPVSGWFLTKSTKAVRVMRNNTPVIRIVGVEGKPDRFVASFRSEFLEATYAVVFSGTITGALALHRFATMI